MGCVTQKERIETFRSHEGHPSCSCLSGLGPSKARTGVEEFGGRVHIVWDHGRPRMRGRLRDECYLGHSKGGNSSLKECRYHSTFGPVRFQSVGTDYRL
jgi:hypothetical protein